MPKANPFGAQSSADQVIAGIDLTGKHIVVTGCNSGIGFATMSALAANGAHVIGLARSIDLARAACARAAPSSTAVACDLTDFRSIGAAVAKIRELGVSLDAIVANAAIAQLPKRETRYGVEMHFLTNYLGHFVLLNELVDNVRTGVGRIVIVGAAVREQRGPEAGIMFDNLDGGKYYNATAFYRQSKLASALYAKELSRRLSGRSICVNSLHPGATRSTRLHRHASRPARILWAAVQILQRDVQHGAATQTLLAASPRVAGLSGQHWTNCAIAKGHPIFEDVELARRLWSVSTDLVARHYAPVLQQWQQAA